MSGRAYVLTSAADIRTVRQPWLIPGLIPLGTITVCAGRGGAGKSSWVLERIARLTRGELVGDVREPANAIIVGPEDDWSAVMNPRLMAAEADLERVSKFEIRTNVGPTVLTTNPILPLDVQELRKAIEQTRAKLVMLDPAASLIAGDLNKREDVRAAMDQLAVLARDAECAIVVIAHFGKGQGYIGDKISGSAAIRDAARCVLLFAEDGDTGQRILTVDKSNYASNAGDSHAFLLQPTLVVTDDGHRTEVARVLDLGPSDKSVAEVINQSGGEGAPTRNGAQGFILEYLRNEAGWEAPASEVLEAGKAVGFSEQEIRDARRRCRSPKIGSKKSGFGSGWMWHIEGGEGSAVQVPATIATFAPVVLRHRLKNGPLVEAHSHESATRH